MESSASLDGRVELKGLLGAGGMGEVHRAWDRALERAVAVKFFLGAGLREAERLLLEGRLQSRVDHPHVVRVLDAGLLQGRSCLVLQLVEGRSLAAVASELSLEQRVELLRQAAQGIHAAHLQGLVHRDVKPGNILVEQGPGEPRALVADFGLARGDESGLTRSGFAAGTLVFMSPEQLLGDGPVGFAADVYGLGATLYAVLAGHPPHQAPESSMATPTGSPDVFRRILEAPPPPLPREVPRPLARVVAKAMERNPRARYESAEAFAADLGRFQRGEPVSARPATWAERALAWQRRNRAFAGALAAAVTALLLSLGWSAWNARKADLEALDAARLGALGESMEAELRMEYLSPPHDVRPALVKVRAQVDALRPQAARGDGPASFALGKGLELLGDVEGARNAFEQAWAKGFRIPRVAEGLGRALGEQYRQARQRAYETLEPSAREQRLAVLKTELRDPAIHYLTLADSGGWRTAFLKASIALLEGDVVTTHARAEEVLAAEPNRYEARVLEAQAHLAHSHAEGSTDASLSELDQAASILKEAAAWGRSDPNLVETLLRTLIARHDALTSRGRALTPEELAASDEAVAQTAALVSLEDPVLMELRAELLLGRVYQTAYTGAASEVVRLAKEPAELFRKYLRENPRDVRAHCGLGSLLYLEAYHLFKQRADPSALIEEGLTVLERARSLAPSDPRVYGARAYLLSVRAYSLTEAGRPNEGALREWIAAASESLRLGARNPATAKRRIGEAYIELGRERWRTGGDPRAEFEKGIAWLEEARRPQKDRIDLTAQTAMAYADRGEALGAMGEDGSPDLDKAADLLREFNATQPGQANIQTGLAQVLFMDAERRTSLGSDPSANLAEVRGLLERNSRVPGNVYLELVLAALPVLEASWKRARGHDASALLDRAELEMRKILAGHPTDAATWYYLARVAEERALRLRGLSRDPTPAAREGLEALEHARDVSREPEFWRLRSRLSSLAGDRAQAKESLEHAWSIQPLFKRGPDSKTAEAELEALGTEHRQTEDAGSGR